MDTTVPQPAPAPAPKKRFHYLLAALIGQLVISPFLTGTPGFILQDLLFLAILLAALRASRQSAFFRPLLVLALSCGLFVVIKYVTNNPLPAVVGDLLGVCMILMTAIGVASSLIRRARIELDTVLGGLCVYLFIGAMWFSLYALVERLSPGAFDFTVHGHNLGPMESNRLLFFFSYVTLLTTGYGDIIPISPVAQTLAILEGVVGVFYGVFFMALLVGLYVSQVQRDGFSQP